LRVHGKFFLCVWLWWVMIFEFSDLVCVVTCALIYLCQERRRVCRPLEVGFGILQ
jgi:hypothetical protein